MLQDPIAAKLLEVLHAAIRLIETTPAQPAVEPAKPVVKSKASGLPRGVYRAQSKYNPYRATITDPHTKRAVNLGMLPSIAKAQQARRDYLAGKPVTSGTKAGKPVRVLTLRKAG